MKLKYLVVGAALLLLTFVLSYVTMPVNTSTALTLNSFYQQLTSPFELLLLLVTITALFIYYISRPQKLVNRAVR